MANRPLQAPQTDYNGFAQANQITARAGEVYGQNLQEGLAKLGAGIGGGLQASKQRKQQLEMQRRSLAQDEMQSLRANAMQQAHLDAETTKAVIGMHNERYKSAESKAQQYRMYGMEVPADVQKEMDDAKTDMGGAMARFTMKTGGRAAELGITGSTGGLGAAPT